MSKIFAALLALSVITAAGTPSFAFEFKNIPTTGDK
jgi:hypothetical protein